MIFITRNLIFYDLENSPYTFNTGRIVYCFSSKLHLCKFKKQILENRDTCRTAFENKLKIECDIADLADINLYEKIETRGFLLKCNALGKEGIICQKSRLLLSGEILIVKN